MAVDSNLADLRRGIQDICREVGGERLDGEVANDVILRLVRERLSAELEALSPQLVQMAVVKIISDLGSRRRVRAVSAGQDDLFGTYDVPGLVSVGRGRRRDVSSLTVEQTRRYLDAHGRQQKDRHAELRRLLEDCLPFLESEHDTLGVLMERRARADPGRRR